MGVFARFRRKSKDTEEASTTEASADTLTAEPEAAGESPEPESGKEEAKAEAAAEDETKADTEADAETEGKTEDEAESTEEAAAENVDIPKQQSAEKAADNDEADEGARK
ncbi:hypothetical protein ACFQ7F_15745 [Streptomyces sp. NPDC056486]|uniref:hypothetical protein n=1 Tax=Streptomyces sp. NPDC056486 TaxID=3345835 RepID=UPI00369FA8FD